MPKRPWLSSALSTLIVIAAALVMVGPESRDADAGLATMRDVVEPASADELRALDIPADLPPDLPRPDPVALPRPLSNRRTPTVIPPTPGAPAPVPPPIPLEASEAWWTTQADLGDAAAAAPED